MLGELRQRVWSYLAGMGIAITGAVASGAGSVSQRLCSSACLSCGACTLAALPLLALLFKKAEGRMRYAILALAVLLAALSLQLLFRR
ncbi:MAG: hypothetical protein GXO66_00155 [Euryarchaeota archaeon]|nr:hypothetical protein [Euryarchaeota archaeon]